MTRCPACGHHNGRHADDCEGPATEIAHAPCAVFAPLSAFAPSACWNCRWVRSRHLREDDPDIINVPMSIETY